MQDYNQKTCPFKLILNTNDKENKSNGQLTVRYLNTIITHSPPRAHTYPLFNKFKILNIFNIYKYQVSCFVFLHMQKLLPSPLSSLFVLNSDCHQYLTRQKDNLHLHTHKYSFSLRVQGPQIWNDIPLSLRNSLTLSSYKHKLRNYFQSL